MTSDELERLMLLTFAAAIAPAGEDSESKGGKRRNPPLSREGEWWRSCLVAGEIQPGRGWPGEIATTELHASFVAWSSYSGAYAQIMPVLGKALMKMVPGLSRRRLSGQDGNRYWVHVLPSLEQCRRTFNAVFGTDGGAE